MNVNDQGDYMETGTHKDRSDRLKFLYDRWDDCRRLKRSYGNQGLEDAALLRAPVCSGVELD